MNQLKKILEKIRHNKLVTLIDQMLWRISNPRMQAYSAQIAYFTLLSVFPFLMVLLNVISRFTNFNPEAVNDLISLLPNDAQEITKLVLSDLKIGFGSDFQLIIAILGGLYSASLGIKPIITACHLSFGYEHEKKGFGLLITSFVFTLVFIAMILLLFMTQVLGDRMFEYISDFLNLPQFLSNLWYYLSHLITPLFLMTTIFLLNRFSFSSRVRKQIPIRHQLPGAALSTAMMILLSWIFAITTNYSNKYALTYGSISGVIMLIVWLYLMGMSLIIGFELNGSIHEIATKSREALKEKSIIEQILRKKSSHEQA